MHTLYSSHRVVADGYSRADDIDRAAGAARRFRRSEVPVAMPLTPPAGFCNAAKRLRISSVGISAGMHAVAKDWAAA